MQPFKLAGVALSVLFLAGRAPAATVNITVSNSDQLLAAFATADANPQNFYEVYLEWRHDAQNNTITWYPSRTITLTKGRVHVHGSNTKSYPEKYLIDGSSRQGVFLLQKTTSTIPVLYLDGITVQNGKVGLTAAGGGVHSYGGYLYILNSVFKNNSANQDGAAIRIDDGFYQIEHTLVDGNTIDQYNSCSGRTGGGGGLAIAGTAWGSIRNSTFSNNKACWGGGIEKAGTGDLTMWNCTLSRNLVKKRGGGIIFYTGSGTTTMHFNTIAYNTAGIDPLTSGYGSNFAGGLGMDAFDGMINLYGNIIAQNTVVNNPKSTLYYKTSDCYWNGGAFTSGAKVQDNIIGEIANCSQFGSSFWWGIGWDNAPFDPKLSPVLQTWGSATGSGFAVPVHMPASDSPVRGNYSERDPVSAACEPLDERSYRRPFADDPSRPRCDIGAVEQSGTP
jgi:hypothetical protein